MIEGALREYPHRRLNALTGEWVLVSPHRALRPWQGQVEELPPDTRPAYDPACYLCPGNARAGGERNPDYAGTFVFDNDFAALRPDAPRVEMNEGGLLVARTETGVARVICFSPRHDLSLPEMEVAAIRGVVDLWAEQYAELGARPDIGHVQIFENKGEMMGSSNPHPHGQIWAQRSIGARCCTTTCAWSWMPASGSCWRTTRSWCWCRSGRCGPSRRWW
jgi:UDPglucose--hexose-1-phosphate uridylyltransferase